MVFYSCEKCGKPFNQKGHYNKHISKKIPCINETKLKEIINVVINEINNKEKNELNNSNDLEDMKKSGLVKVVGNNIEITSKGENVIRVMILGDDRSSYEEDGIIMDYNTSLKNIKSVKTAKKRNKSWWDSFPK